MNTRRFSLLRAGTSMLIALLLAFQPTLSGCSKDKKSTEPEEPAPPVETGPADGEVNRDEIGGEELIVLSVWDEGRSVSPEGSFEVTVSREGAQLLVLQDGTGNARGLTISLPGERIESLSFDARSTALALLMMTPGILSVDPAEASARISSIENLEEFQPLVSLLEANLPSRTLGEVVDTQGIREAMEDCVRSWEVQSTRAFESLLPTDYGLAATIVDASDLGNTRVVLSNAAWRFVSVHRRELNTEGTEERVVAVDANELPVLTSMGGATPVGWGSLFTHHVGNPTSAEDLTNFSTEGRIGKVDYWFEGPGFAEGGAQPPGSIPSDWKEPITLSIVWYLMFPLIDLYLGAERLHHQGPQALERAYGIVKNGITLSELAQASSVAELIDASLDVTFRGLVVIADIGAASGTAGLFGISAPVWATVGTMVAVLGAGFALANVLIAVDSWSSVPRFCTVSVNNPSDIVAPAAVGDLAAGAVTATTVQLTWTSPGDDGNQGTAVAYDLRYWAEDHGWNEGTTIETADPRPAGETESLIADGLTPETTYRFGIKTSDDRGNWSELSNVASATTAEAGMVHTVRPDGNGDYPTIQAAIDAVGDGHLILLTEGVFKGEGNRDIDYLGKAITIASVGGDPELCIIDCEGRSGDSHRGFLFQHGEPQEAILAGVTVRSGYAQGGYLVEDSGGGVYCKGSSPSFSNCVFMDNHATRLGGGVVCYDGSEAQFRNCTFLRNDTERQGGGIMIFDGSSVGIHGCIFRENAAPSGGGGHVTDSAPEIASCLFVQNRAENGGGLAYGFASSGTLSNCEFLENRADSGGGVSCWHDTSPLITKCVFAQNTAGYGGGVYFGWAASSSARIDGCTFVGNSASVYGGGGILCTSASLELRNCTLVSNQVGVDDRGSGIECLDGGSLRLGNVLVAYGIGGLAVTSSGGANVLLSCCDLYGNDGGDWAGEIADQDRTNGNFSADPLFCDPERQDLRLRMDSPCHPDSSACGLIGAWVVGCDERGFAGSR